ncbi:MBL fold metallo-hydrolase [Adhaeribacter aquaticus]|uniref:MBL fold metallo-hydrolase n=1 Tax=Adhaeribacter aquaticus TaxID=299567 RepID=UPI0004271EF7|nr:MBL fold metallo-hydrolase [Adhaeribacter aquaticus]
MKIKNILFLLLVFTYYSAIAQLPAPDQLDTKNGKLVIQPIQHGTVAFKWNNKTIFVDPYGGTQGFAGLGDPDLILLTDIHGDHLDFKTLEGINTAKAVIVAPQAVAEKLTDNLKKKLVVLKNGDKTTQLGIQITAVPMYNLPEAPDAMHVKGRGNGYILNMGGKNVYLSGDTEDTPEVRGLKNIDVAFLSMNLPYTMDVNQAAQAVLAFRPKIVYPYHYRGQGGLSDVESFKKQVNADNKEIEVRLRNWYPNN